MEQQVELADGQRFQVAFLAVEREIAKVSALFPHVLRRIDEHTRRTFGWILVN